MQRRLPASGGTCGHQPSRPNSGLPERQQRRPPVGAAGHRAAAPGPRRRHPGGAGGSRASSSAAPLSTIAHSRCQVAALSGWPAALGLDGGQQPELGDEALVVRGQLAVDPGRERVARPARAPAAGRRSRRQRALSGNHGKAQLATSCPAASAMTWLLADEPRLRNAARYCWCQRIWRTASVVALEQVGDAGPVVEQPPDPGQADQPDADLDAAGPVHAGQERVLAPPGAQLVGHPLGVGLVAGEEPRRGQQREVLQAGDLPDLLDVAGLLLRAVVDPERVALRLGTRARSPGRGTSRARPGRSGPRRAPPTARPASCCGRRGDGRRALGRAPAPRCPRGRTAVKSCSAGSGRGGRGELAAGGPAGATRPRRRAWSRARQATSAGDIRPSRRAYQPSREVAPQRLTRAPGGRSARLSPTAMVARVVADQRVERRSASGRRSRTASTNCASSRALALVLAAAGARGALLRPDQTVASGEVVEPGAAAAAGGVQRLLRVPRVARGDVRDGAGRRRSANRTVACRSPVVRAADGVDLDSGRLPPTS